MLPNAKVCLYPKSFAEAVRILEREGRRALIVAGGTSAILSRDPTVSTLVDLTRMGPPAGALMRRGGEWFLGCNVRLQELAVHPGMAKLWNGMLSQAAGSAGSRPIRNAVTLGGNAVAVFRWSDPPVALLALDAAFDLVGARGRRRTLRADSFFARHPRQMLRPAEILAGVRIDIPRGRHGGAFYKHARTAFDIAVVDLAVCLWFSGRRCRRARVAVGATRNLPWRSLKAEEILCGRELTEPLIAAAARAAREQTGTAADVRSGGEYRRQMVEVIARRTIARARDAALEG